MNEYIYDSQKQLYLGLDPDTTTKLWAVDTKGAHQFARQEDIDLVLALLNNEEQPFRYVARKNEEI